MKIVVDKPSVIISEMSEPDISYKLKNGTDEVYVWGAIHLFKEKAFDEDCLIELASLAFEDSIPLLTGQFIIALVENMRLKQLAVDFYGHSGAYIQEKEQLYVITDDIKVLHFDEHYDFDRFQLRHFVDKGYCWESGTFIKQLSKISPTITYIFDRDGIHQDFLPFPTFVKDGTLDNCVANTLKEIVKKYKKVGLFFSSGVDSSYIREVSIRNNINITPVLHYQKKPRYFAPEEDYDLSMRLNEGRGDIQVRALEDSDAHFAATIKTTVRMLPFDFHPAIIQSHIYPLMEEEGYKMMISGQNSDSVYALAATHHTPIKQTLKQLLTFRLHNSGLKSDFKRYVQTGRFLKKLQKGKPSWWTKIIWRKLNPDYQFNFENLLMAYLKEDCELPIICHDKNDQLEAEYIAQYQEFVHKLNVLFERGETPRMVMIRGKLLGHCQGRDVRCMTEWAKECHMGNIQIFTSGPVLSWLGTHNLGFKDIFVGKRELRHYLEKKINYSRLKEKVPDYRNIEGVVSSELIRFHDMYLSLNSKGEMDMWNRKACDMLKNENIISDKEYRLYSSKDYNNNKPRLVWLAQSINNLLNN